MSIADMQEQLAAIGHDPGALDGRWGPNTEHALDAALTGGNHARLTDTDLVDAAKTLQTTAAHVGAVCDVESAGVGFDPTTLKPIVRFEAHQFQRLTKSRFDALHPELSHAYSQRHAWPMPTQQASRWARLIYPAVALDPEAAFAATSFGLFQIMGFNHTACGFGDATSFALAMAHSERDQLMAFCVLLVANGWVSALQRGDWATFAAAYNGLNYRDNDYDGRLARAFAQRSAIASH